MFSAGHSIQRHILSAISGQTLHRLALRTNAQQTAICALVYFISRLLEGILCLRGRLWSRYGESRLGWDVPMKVSPVIMSLPAETLPLRMTCGPLHEIIFFRT